MNIDRTTKLVLLVISCFTLVGSGAGLAMTQGAQDQRLTAVELRQKLQDGDHDRIVAVEANVAWIVRAMGGEPKKPVDPVAP